MTETLPLTGWRVAIPESRQLDLFADMLEQRGADAFRCPLVSIYDSPEVDVVEAWLQKFINEGFDDLIILTGEGIKRLSGFAERAEMSDAWIDALARVRKIVRGPKPGRVLREYKLKPEVLANAPTTDGIIDTLKDQALAGRKIAVQLYGEEPNEKLQSFLREKGADISVVAPYIYAPDSETDRVQQLVNELISGAVDVMVFTSMQQVPRLINVAKKMSLQDELLSTMNKIVIAAIGPVVADKLEALNVAVTLQPDEKFFMKPMVRKLVEYVQLNPKVSKDKV